MITSPMAKALILLLHAGFGLDVGREFSSLSTSKFSNNKSGSGAVVTSPKRTLLSDCALLGRSSLLVGVVRVTFAFISCTRGLGTDGDSGGLQHILQEQLEADTEGVQVYGL